jgi:hypothetical protein
MVAVAQQSQVAAAILVRDYHDDLRLVDGPPAGPGHGGLSGRAARRALPQCHSHCVPVPLLLRLLTSVPG